MPKLLVEIILANKQRITKKCPIDGNRIIINKGKKGFGGKEWAPKFSEGCIIGYWTGIWPFKSYRQKLVVKDEAEECIDFSKTPVEPASWDKHSAEQWMKARVLKHAGEVELKAQVPIVFYVGLVLSILTLIIIFAQSRGLRF